MKRTNHFAAPDSENTHIATYTKMPMKWPLFSSKGRKVLFSLGDLCRVNSAEKTTVVVESIATVICSHFRRVN